MKTERIAGRASWRVASDKVEFAVTRAGGHLGPVVFRTGGRRFEPFAIAPWAEEKQPPGLPPMLGVLRGDFFCAPFGGNSKPWKKEHHPPHGDTANANWKYRSLETRGDTISLHLRMETTSRPGQVDKFISLRRGHTAVYCRHILSRMRGPMCLGHHAMLRFPPEAGAGCISTSRIRFAQTCPEPLECPADKGYSSLLPGASFRRLDRVRTVFGGITDIGSYSARKGFEDLALVAHQSRHDFAWIAVAFPKLGYLWYALKDPRVLQSTVMWFSNGGRHYPPWNGRHTGVMGLEDVTAYFHFGLAESATDNPLRRRGIKTTLELDPNIPLEVNYIMGIVPISSGFKKAANIVPAKDHIQITSTNGHKLEMPVAIEHLQSKA